MASKRENIDEKYVYKSLCVQPNDTPPEAQYESFQAIFADIMRSQPPPQLDISLMTPYELLCYKSNITLMMLKKSITKQEIIEEYNKLNTGIDINSAKIVFFYPDRQSTHYRAFVNGKILNPYDNYQVNDTQGYCQTFAFFLATSDTDDFISVKQGKRLNTKKFNELALNTQMCATKIFDILDNDPDIMEKFKKEFNTIYNNPKSREHYGIKIGTTCEQYLHDFRWINSNLNCVKDYIFDLGFPGYTIQKLKDELWFSYNIEPEIWATMQMSKKRSLETQKSKTNKRTKTKKTKTKRTSTMAHVGAGKKKKQTKQKKKRGGTRGQKKEEYDKKRLDAAEIRLAIAEIINKKRKKESKSKSKNPKKKFVPDLEKIPPDLQETVGEELRKKQDKKLEKLRIAAEKEEIEKKKREEKELEAYALGYESNNSTNSFDDELFDDVVPN